MSRASPYLIKKNDTFEEDVAAMRSTPLFLVSKSGPTVFIIKTDVPQQKPFKAFIGDNQRCSCGGGEGRGRLCVHLLFVMIKVLRVPETNPLAWQLSLVDSEVTAVLAGKFTATTSSQRHAYLRRGSTGDNTSANAISSGTSKQPSRERQELVDDEVCPICQDDMTKPEMDEGQICFCESSCGNNLHVKCLLMYATHMQSEKKPVTCPMCRADWGELPSKGKGKRKGKIDGGHGNSSCTGTVANSTGGARGGYNANMPILKCKACKIVIRSTFYRCVVCTPTFEFCRRCFEANSNRSYHNMGHPFVSADANLYPAEWKSAVPPIDRSQTLR